VVAKTREIAQKTQWKSRRELLFIYEISYEKKLLCKHAAATIRNHLQL
jgi:hypothetical protein